MKHLILLLVFLCFVGVVRGEEVKDYPIFVTTPATIEERHESEHYFMDKVPNWKCDYCRRGLPRLKKEEKQ